MTNTDIHTLPEEVHDQWHQFIEGVNRVVAEVFAEDQVAVVIGAQWGGMGAPDSTLPDCVVTSNLPACLVPDALADMQAFAESAHDDYHGIVREEVSADAVPQEVRDEAVRFAESVGLSAENVKFIVVDETGDLSDEAIAALEQLPLFPATVEDEQESKEQ